MQGQIGSHAFNEKPVGGMHVPCIGHRDADPLPSTMMTTAHLALAYLLLEWVIRLIMLVVIPLRRPPEAARSWLLLVLFLPVPAGACRGALPHDWPGKFPGMAARAI